MSQNNNEINSPQRFLLEHGTTLVEVTLVASLVAIILFLGYFSLNSAVESSVSNDGKIVEQSSPLDD